MPDRETTNVASVAVFRTTHWSMVLAAGQTGEAGAAAALEQLCRTYWMPLYGYLRCQSITAPDAQDLVQGLFASLLERKGLAAVNPKHGKFRSFLLATLKHFVSNERDRAHAQKRGGRFLFVPLDEIPAHEEIFASSDLSPEQVYEQTWAMALIECTTAKLREEYVTSGRAEMFAALEPYLASDRKGPPYVEVAKRLNLGESGVKMAVQRMRRRFGELLRSEVAQTVGSPQEVDEEIRALFASLHG